MGAEAVSFWSDPDFYALAVPIAAVVITVGTAIVHVGLRVGRVMRRAVHLLDDLAGEPAREGVPARPGVMARLAALEARTQVLVARVGDTGPIPRVDLQLAELATRMNNLEQHVRGK